MSDTPEEYTVGPCSHHTWLVIYEMACMGRRDAPEQMQEEYREAMDEFLAAHPDEAINDPAEEWSESMKNAWDATVTEWMEEEL